MSIKRGKVQIECSCCGVFSQARMCSQCVFAGCDRRKKGERCRIDSGVGARPVLEVLPNLAGALSGIVMHAAGKAVRKLDRAAARGLREIHRGIEETQL